MTAFRRDSDLRRVRRRREGEAGFKHLQLVSGFLAQDSL